MLARRLIRAADLDEMIQADAMISLAHGRPELHTPTRLHNAASALGVAREVEDLLRYSAK